MIKSWMKNKQKNIRFNIENDRDYSLLLLVGFLGGVAGGINVSIFTNFLNDTYHLSAAARGFVELPRELPGLMIVFVLASLSSLGDTRVASLGMLAASIGMIGLGFLSPTFWLMVIFMMIFSLGTHMFMPLAPSIGMGLSEKEQYGARLGKFNSYNLVATIIGYGIVWLGFTHFHFNYSISFMIAAFFYFLASVALNFMKQSVPHHKSFKIILRKKYTLYYILCIVNGARKQIFLTFAPFVLVIVFHLTPQVFAILGVIVALISIFTRTIVGKAIDIKGERFVLSWEAVLLFILCIGYAFAADFFSASVAVVIIAICYVLDNSLSTVEMARSTYLSKIAVDPSDITHTLATGTSLDHIISMSIPIFGGMLWLAVGYKYVFIFAAGIALLNLFLSLKIGKVNDRTEQ